MAREEFLQDTITTRRSTQIGTVGYPVVRPSPTLAYSTLWRPNGRGLQSTPFKRSKDPLEYHGVLLFFSYPVREESPQLGASRPYTFDVHKESRSKEGSNTHKSTAKCAHTRPRIELKDYLKVLTRTELESLRMTNKCAKTECG